MSTTIVSLLSNLVGSGSGNKTFIVTSEAEQLALKANVGDIAIRTDISKTFILKEFPPSNINNWQELAVPVDKVLKVFGREGLVVAKNGDYNTDQVTEASNLYYTLARFNSAFSSKSTSDLDEGSNLYYTDERFNTAFNAKSTTDLAEGINQYFTNQRALSSVEKTNELTGFTVSGGTSSSKILKVLDDCEVDQDLTKASDVTFNLCRADSGLSLFSGNTDYRVFFDTSYIRSNVSLHNSPNHGFRWSGGLFSGTMVDVMKLTTEGKLSVGGQSAEAQVDIKEDLRLGVISATPANPSTGVKIYYKSDGKIYARGSSGSEYKMRLEASDVLNIVEKTNENTGFTVSGGTSASKILKVLDDCEVDQNLTTSSDVTHRTVSSSLEIKVGEVALAPDNPTTGIYLYSKFDKKLYARNENGVEVDLFAGFNGFVTSFNGETGDIFPKFSLNELHSNPLRVYSENSGVGTSDWIAGTFGAKKGTSKPTIVIGNIEGKATIGAHSEALNAWANMHISNPQSFCAIGAPSDTEAKAHLHSFGSTILGHDVAQVANGELSNNQMNIWNDISNEKIVLKSKDNVGTITNFEIRNGLRVVTTSDNVYTITGEEDIIECDTTSNSVLIVIDTAVLKRQLTVINPTGGLNDSAVVAGSGQTLNGSASTFPVGVNYEHRIVIPSSDPTQAYALGR